MKETIDVVDQLRDANVDIMVQEMVHEGVTEGITEGGIGVAIEVATVVVAEQAGVVMATVDGCEGGTAVVVEGLVAMIMDVIHLTRYVPVLVSRDLF